MASVTDTARPERASWRRRRLWTPPSRIGRLIFLLNLVALAILVGGTIGLNELRQGLVQARVDSLRTEGQLIANVMDGAATIGEPDPALEADAASDILQSLVISKSQRVRLFDAEGNMIADSFIVTDRIERIPLPPATKPGQRVFSLPGFNPPPATLSAAQSALRNEVDQALKGSVVSAVRPSENGGRVVSVSIPIERVRAVLGVLTLEAGDVDQIIAAERASMAPFVITAVAVNLISSLALTQLVAQPIRRLARAADRVRLKSAREIALPDIAERRDELGDLARSLEDMTRVLSDRMEAIERFAADVAHEIRNPLTSIRSAVETLDLVQGAEPRERLLNILKQDVSRLDRLITDISNASRLDAELSRESPRPVPLGKLLRDMVSLYGVGGKGASVRLIGARGDDLVVMGREGPLGQVFRNLIDNARSFSPPGAEVRVILAREHGQVIVTIEDDGPGMPPENLETVFERFYTSRPKGAAFGGNSGLGLSIARQIAEAHDGSVHAENRTDQAGAVVGARFVVVLPAVGSEDA
jgi:two-component system sensor histidine kinase ChvG